jgi:hypothetical protein
MYTQPVCICNVSYLKGTFSLSYLKVTFSREKRREILCGSISCYGDSLSFLDKDKYLLAITEILLLYKEHPCHT